MKTEQTNQVALTPLPWYATEIHVQSAVINEDNYVCEAEGTSREQAEANAAFIVRACNAHDDLVEALTMLYYNSCPPIGREKADRYSKACELTLEALRNAKA